MSKKLVIEILMVCACILLLSVPKAFAPCYPPNNNAFCLGNFDHDCDVDGTNAAQFKQHFGRKANGNPCSPSGPAMVPRTGQVSNWFPYDDGSTQCGIAWPNPRFTVNGDGTVTDNLTGLVWIRDLSCLDQQNMVSCSQLAYDCEQIKNEDCGLADESSPGDWRLPTINELLSLIDYSQYDPILPPSMFTNWGVQLYEEYCSSTVCCGGWSSVIISLKYPYISNRGTGYYGALCVKNTHPYCPETVTTVPTTTTTTCIDELMPCTSSMECCYNDVICCCVYGPGPEEANCMNIDYCIPYGYECAP